MDDQRSVEDGKDTAATDDSHSGLLRFIEHTPETSLPQNECTQQPTAHMDVGSLGELFEHCIQQVSRLERQRDELIQELLRLQEPVLRVVDHLRGKLAGTRRLLTLAQLDHVAVYEEVQQVKRKLFGTARDCIQSQVTLAEQEYEVAQSAVTQVQQGPLVSLLSVFD